MYTLFIDTHFKDVKILLFKDNEVISRKIISDIKNTSVETMPSIVSVLGEESITPNDLNKIAVCVGPGSFTGVRIGVTIAKTMAYSLNIPIVSLTSIDLIGINLDKESYVAVKENNGAFIALYNNKIIGDIKYLKNSELEEFKNNNEVIDDILIDENKLINYINTLEESNPHNVNPIYIKNVEGIK